MTVYSILQSLPSNYLKDLNTTYCGDDGVITKAVRHEALPWLHHLCDVIQPPGAFEEANKRHFSIKGCIMHQIGMHFVILDNPFIRRGFSENYEYHVALSNLKNIFSSFSCMFLNPNYFFQFEI